MGLLELNMLASGLEIKPMRVENSKCSRLATAQLITITLTPISRTQKQTRTDQSEGHYSLLRDIMCKIKPKKSKKRHDPDSNMLCFIKKK